ncbi:hypothetical protein VB10N_08350 [Vibrio sp. 10N]|nr:hypothetical protein VB10N_08350 [Vibrio sp. 10N]
MQSVIVSASQTSFHTRFPYVGSLLNQPKIGIIMKILTTCWLAVLLLVAPSASVWAADGDKLEGIEITVNINQAEPEELAELLKGVGIEKAQKIVDYRKQHGKFTSADDLTAVKGIGAATVEKNRDRITL